MGRFKIKKKSLSDCGVKVEVTELVPENYEKIIEILDRSIQSQFDTLGYAEWETGDYEYRIDADGEWWRISGETEWREGEPPGEDQDSEQQSGGTHEN